ncbi:MAG: DUF2950 domain-containing protein [Syntrophus sp. (in: bacteria)]|nr:DUF2950 domain-containing protein [Syntrophus sp. (in: bacteria)]
MFHTFLKIKDSLRGNFSVAVLAVLFVICAVGVPGQAAGKGIQQITYGSPEDAVQALIDAMKSNDAKQMGMVLGPLSRDIFLSGDEVADREILESFLNLYNEKNNIEKKGNSEAILLVGKKDWPMPIPIVKKGNRWLFDTGRGREEILNRRIGRNELAVINVCEAYVDAQQEFALLDSDGDGLFEYAQKFWSSPGKKDGLYWETKEDETPSPFGPFAAKAKAEGYVKTSASDQPQPYHGYFYKILKGQGKSAKGGAYDYVVNGNMIGGFALVAYPAQYGNSGIMTFIVNQDGVVYQKNLGRDTAKKAQAMSIFDPDKTWKKVETTVEATSTKTDSDLPEVQGEKE